jgi:hypothetical protein
VHAELGGLGRATEGLGAVVVGIVPERCGGEARDGASMGGHVCVSQAPADGFADSGQGESQDVVDGGRFVRRDGDGSEQLQLLLLLIELAQATFGDDLGLETGASLALKAASQPAELGGV